MAASDTVLDRFADKHLIGDDCWPWLGGKNQAGYGRFCPDGRKQVPAHTFAWELVNGPMPVGTEIDHLCRNPSCINPSHLEAVTHLENVRRSVRVVKDRCLRDHEYNETNTRIGTDGSRDCRVCDRDRVRRRRALLSS